jgi:hypothetical protein
MTGGQSIIILCIIFVPRSQMVYPRQGIHGNSTYSIQIKIRYIDYITTRVNQNNNIVNISIVLWLKSPLI